jgi:hypothetical protein
LEDNAGDKSIPIQRFEELVGHVVGDLYKGGVYRSDYGIIPLEKWENAREAIHWKGTFYVENYDMGGIVGIERKTNRIE